MTPQDLENRMIDFSISIINMTKQLPKEFAAEYISKQIIRFSTAVALNYGEVRDAESNKDFIHKLKICLKELRETMVGLKIISKLNWLDDKKMKIMLKENDELISICVSSVKKMKAKS